MQTIEAYITPEQRALVAELVELGADMIDDLRSATFAPDELVGKDAAQLFAEYMGATA